MRNPRAGNGFTLLEVVIVIGIMAIMAGALVPYIVRPFVVERTNETVREMQALEEAIVGRPELNDHGFVGTVGRPPLNATELLVRPAAVPAASFSNPVTGVLLPVGWNGPYLRASSYDPTSDAWGNPYIFEFGGPAIVGTNPPAVNNSWRVRSRGPDRTAGTTDDIVFPSNVSTVYAQSYGTISIQLGAFQNGTRVPLNSSQVHFVSVWAPNGSGALRCWGLNPGCAVANGTCAPDVNGNCQLLSGGNPVYLPHGPVAVRVRMRDATDTPAGPFGCSGDTCLSTRNFVVRRPTNVFAYDVLLPPGPSPAEFFAPYPFVAGASANPGAVGNTAAGSTDANSGYTHTRTRTTKYEVHASGHVRGSVGGGYCYLGIRVGAEMLSLAGHITTGKGYMPSIQRTNVATDQEMMTTTRVFVLSGAGTETISVVYNASPGNTCDFDNVTMQGVATPL